MPIPENTTTLFADANVCNEHGVRELQLLLSICETMTLRTPLNDFFRTSEIHYDTTGSALKPVRRSAELVGS